MNKETVSATPYADSVDSLDRRARWGEPQFSDPDQAVRWRTARRAVLDHVLSVITESSARNYLVLRGSMTLQAWCPGQAREPVDLDWVVEPPSDDQPYGDLVDRVRRSPEAADGVVLCVDEMDEDEDWIYVTGCYDVSGIRLTVPWTAAGLPRGVINLDFACDEELHTGPVPTWIPRGDGGKPVAVRAASREQSLAWKITWLTRGCEDGDFREKDLYDAVLLAEDPKIRLTADFLRGALTDYLGYKPLGDYIRESARLRPVGDRSASPPITGQSQKTGQAGSGWRFEQWLGVFHRGSYGAVPGETCGLASAGCGARSRSLTGSPPRRGCVH